MHLAAQCSPSNLSCGGATSGGVLPWLVAERPSMADMPDRSGQVPADVLAGCLADPSETEPRAGEVGTAQSADVHGDDVWGGEGRERRGAGRQWGGPKCEDSHLVLIEATDPGSIAKGMLRRGVERADVELIRRAEGRKRNKKGVWSIRTSPSHSHRGDTAIVR